MSYAQWLWEYEALREREKEQLEFAGESFKVLKDILIDVLGLGLLRDKDDKESFMPLSLIAGRREMVEFLFDKMDEGEKTKEVMEDEHFEALSAAIAQGDDLGDMEPIMDVSNMDAIAEKGRLEAYHNELRSAGVNIVQDIKRNVPHIGLDKEKIEQKRKEMSHIKSNVQEEINKPTVKFDE